MIALKGFQLYFSTFLNTSWTLYDPVYLLFLIPDSDSDSNSDFRFPISKFQFPISDFRFPISDSDFQHNPKLPFRGRLGPMTYPAPLVVYLVVYLSCVVFVVVVNDEGVVANNEVVNGNFVSIYDCS